MATLQDVIRRITISAKAEGVDTTTASLRGLSGEMGGVVATSETLGASTLSMATKLNTLQRSLDAEFAAEAKLEAIHKTLTAARNQGLISISRENELLDLAAAKYKVVSESAKTMGESIKTAKEFAMGLASGLGAGIIFTGLAELPSKVADVVKEVAGLDHAAETIGITTKALQELQFAGSQFHVDTETMNSSLERFSKNLGQAADGSGVLAKILRENHIIITGDLTTDLKNYSDLVQRAGSAADRNFLITTAFGKNAQELGLLFKEGGAGLQEFMDQADATGAVLGGPLIQNAKDLDAEFIKMKASTDAAWKDFVVTGAPLIIGAMEAITAAIRVTGGAFNDLKKNESDVALAHQALNGDAGAKVLLWGDQNDPELGLKAALATLKQFNVETTLAQYPTGAAGAQMSQINELNDLATAAVSANPPLEDIHKTLQALIDSHPDVAVEGTASALLKLVDSAIAAKGPLDDVAKSLADIPFDTTNIDIFNDALGNLAKIGVPALTAAAKAQNDLDAALAHASGAGAGSIDNIAATLRDIKTREDQAAALKLDTAQAKAFQDGLARLNAEAEKAALDKFAATLPAASQELLKAAESTGLVHQAMTLFLQDTASDGWMAILRDVGLLTTEMRQLEAATAGATAAKSNFETTNYSVPNSSGGMSNVQVIRPAGSAAAAASDNGGIHVIDVNSAKWFAGGGKLSGPGTGTSDSMLARFSTGEYLVNAEATAKHIDLLNAINDNRPIPGFAAGGVLSSAGQLAALARIEGGASPNGMSGLNVLGSTAIGDSVSTQFSFNQAPITPANNPFNDPGLAAFDKNNPNWERYVSDQLRQITASGAQLLFAGGNPRQMLEEQRLVNASYWKSIQGFDNTNHDLAYAWAASQGMTALPSAAQAIDGYALTRHNYQWGPPGSADYLYTGLHATPYTNGDGSPYTPSFATGGAILPGPDSQVVKFNKNPDETVGIFTPSQMKAVGDAMNNNGHGPVTVHFHIGNLQLMPDGRLPPQSRAELQDMSIQVVRKALAGGRG